MSGFRKYPAIVLIVAALAFQFDQPVAADVYVVPEVCVQGLELIAYPPLYAIGLGPWRSGSEFSATRQVCNHPWPSPDSELRGTLTGYCGFATGIGYDWSSYLWVGKVMLSHFSSFSSYPSYHRMLHGVFIVTPDLVNGHTCTTPSGAWRFTFVGADVRNSCDSFATIPPTWCVAWTT